MSSAAKTRLILISSSSSDIVRVWKFNFQRSEVDKKTQFVVAKTKAPLRSCRSRRSSGKNPRENVCSWKCGYSRENLNPDNKFLFEHMVWICMFTLDVRTRLLFALKKDSKYYVVRVVVIVCSGLFCIRKMVKYKQTPRRTKGKGKQGRQPLKAKPLVKNSNRKRAPTAGIKKPKRFRPGTVALRQIRRYPEVHWIADTQAAIQPAGPRSSTGLQNRPSISISGH